jgi:hypothetical protein
MHDTVKDMQTILNRSKMIISYFKKNLETDKCLTGLVSLIILVILTIFILYALGYVKSSKINK